VTQVVQLSEWLELMLAEVARKREELEHARTEQQTREHEADAARSATAARTELT
jgi:hypothetical protein